uniref:Uncharacterized protein n=1 Tax=Rhizophora mucronata TaxID=61149 RepID=A0A2P2N1N8_RHIMU
MHMFLQPLDVDMYL